MSKLILASGSPRRKELLAEMGYTFEIATSDVEELHDANMPLRELCEHNARLKAEDVASGYPDAVVLGADTLVYIDQLPLGKPASAQEALETLKMLNGKSHCVCTGMCVVSGGRSEMFSEVTQVHFKDVDEATLLDYMEKVHVMDKAGSYAIQDHGDLIIESIEGDYANVVGLPQTLVAEKLAQFGLKSEV